MPSFYRREGTGDGFLPVAIQLLALLFLHVWLPSLLYGPILAEIVEAGVKADRQAGGISDAQRGRFADERAHHGNIQDVCLELHEEIVDDHAAIGAQRKKMNLRILFHGFQNFASLEGRSFQNGASDMSFVGETGEAGDDAAGIVAPVGSVESRESGNEVDSAIIADSASERFDVRAFFNEAEIIAEPLDQRASNGDATFQGVDRFLRAKFVTDSGEQSVSGRDGAFAGIHQQKAAGAIGILGFARMEAGLAKERGLLVAEDSGDFYTGNAIEFGFAINFAAGNDARKDGGRNIERGKNFSDPNSAWRGSSIECGWRW